MSFKTEKAHKIYILKTKERSYHPKASQHTIIQTHLTCSRCSFGAQPPLKPPVKQTWWAGVQTKHLIIIIVSLFCKDLLRPLWVFFLDFYILLMVNLSAVFCAVFRIKTWCWLHVAEDFSQVLSLGNLNFFKCFTSCPNESVTLTRPHRTNEGGGFDLWAVVSWGDRKGHLRARLLLHQSSVTLLFPLMLPLLKQGDGSNPPLGQSWDFSVAQQQSNTENCLLSSFLWFL